MEKAMTLPVRIRALRNCRAAAYCAILFLHAREIPGLGVGYVTCPEGLCLAVLQSLHAALPLALHRNFSHL